MKQRFPTLDHVVDTGFMTKNEKKLFEAVPANEFNTYWVPCTWFIFRFSTQIITSIVIVMSVHPDQNS